MMAIRGLFLKVLNSASSQLESSATIIVSFLILPNHNNKSNTLKNVPGTMSHESAQLLVFE